MLEPSSRNPRGILLDAAGTLIYADPPVENAYVAAAERQGVRLNPEIVRTRFHEAFRADEQDDRRNGRLRTDFQRERERWRSIVGRVLAEVPDPFGAFEYLWDDLGRPGSWKCFPDVSEAIRRLRTRGIPFRIASNFDPRLRTIVAGLDELADCRDLLVISSEIGYRKPNADFYREAAKLMGLPPESILSIGDDLENDVVGPRQVGMRSLRVRRGRIDGVECFKDIRDALDAILI